MHFLSQKLPYLFIASSLFLSACDNNSSNDIDYDVEIRRTTAGVPHIQADDWGSLGYGYGYAYAQDNFCVAMREIIISTGQSQRYLGEDGSLARDFVFALLAEDAPEQVIDSQPQNLQDLIRGYADGMNRYLDETGVENLAGGEEGCANAEWVREISDGDLAALLRKLIVRASSDPLAEYIFAQQGPQSVSRLVPQQFKLSPDQQYELQQQIASINLPKPSQLGSNAYGLGSEATQSGYGMLLGNPHFPWQGSNRFYMAHLKMGDEYDVAGASLHGFPLINIGFNQNIAWSHTVSTGKRFVLYELSVNPENLMQYEYDGEMRDFQTRDVTIDVMTESGVEQQTHTFYLSHLGPVVDLGAINNLLAGWPNAAGTVLALKDINVDNFRGVEQWMKMGQANNIDELKTALQDIGIPWVNTIAADRFGTAFYGDISAVPHVSDSKAADCIRGLVAPLLTANGLVTLDGSTSDCELGSDSDSPVNGVFGYSSLPNLSRQDYVANANDSYWLSHPDQLLTGFPSIIGEEEIEQTIRTRATFLQVEQRLAGSDGLGEPGFTLENLQSIMFGSRNHAAELSLNALTTECQAETDWSSYSSTPALVEQACDILDSWDSRHNLDSVGAHIFTEFWFIARDLEQLWATPFSAADPVHTPNTLNTSNSSTADALKQALADAVATLNSNNIELNAPWGAVQFSERNGERIGIHGGSSTMMFSVITSDLIQDEGYSAIEHGNSYMQTVSWDASECPDAFALLSYSQSTDPASEHYADQTKRYADKNWLDMAFCESAISAEQIGETIQLRASVER